MQGCPGREPCRKAGRRSCGSPVLPTRCCRLHSGGARRLDAFWPYMKPSKIAITEGCLGRLYRSGDITAPFATSLINPRPGELRLSLSARESGPIVRRGWSCPPDDEDRPLLRPWASDRGSARQTPRNALEACFRDGPPNARTSSRRHRRHLRSGRRQERCWAPRTWAPWTSGVLAFSASDLSSPSGQSVSDHDSAREPRRRVCGNIGQCSSEPRSGATSRSPRSFSSPSPFQPAAMHPPRTAAQTPKPRRRQPQSRRPHRPPPRPHPRGHRRSASTRFRPRARSGRRSSNHTPCPARASRRAWQVRLRIAASDSRSQGSTTPASHPRMRRVARLFAWRIPQRPTSSSSTPGRCPAHPPVHHQRVPGRCGSSTARCACWSMPPGAHSAHSRARSRARQAQLPTATCRPWARRGGRRPVSLKRTRPAPLPRTGSPRSGRDSGDDSGHDTGDRGLRTRSPFQRPPADHVENASNDE